MQEQETREQKLLKFLKVVDHLKKQKDTKEKAYSSLFDTHAPIEVSSSSRSIIVKKLETQEILLLLKKAQGIIAEYEKMKDFILGYFVKFMTNSLQKHKQNKQGIYLKTKEEIENEMKENLQHITKMAKNISAQQGSSLSKSILFNEMESFLGDLECRLNSYRPYYQSYLLDVKYDGKMTAH